MRTKLIWGKLNLDQEFEQTIKEHLKITFQFQINILSQKLIEIENNLYYIYSTLIQQF